MSPENIMNTKIYVGNLSFGTTENDLRDLFTPHGTVTEVNLIIDKMTGRSRGFAFVSMETAEQVQAAIQSLNEKELDGRALTVNEARPKESSGGGGGFGGGGGGGRGGFGGRSNRGGGGGGGGERRGGGGFSRR